MQTWKPIRAVAVVVPRWDYAASVSKKTGALVNWGQQRTPLSLCWNQLLPSVHSEKTLSSLLLFILSLLRERCCTRSLLASHNCCRKHTKKKNREKHVHAQHMVCVLYLANVLHITYVIHWQYYHCETWWRSKTWGPWCNLADEINGLSNISGNYMRVLFVPSNQWLKIWKLRTLFSLHFCKYQIQ